MEVTRQQRSERRELRKAYVRVSFTTKFEADDSSFLHSLHAIVYVPKQLRGEFTNMIVDIPEGLFTEKRKRGAGYRKDFFEPSLHGPMDHIVQKLRDMIQKQDIATIRIRYM